MGCPIAIKDKNAYPVQTKMKMSVSNKRHMDRKTVAEMRMKREEEPSCIHLFGM